MVNKILPVAALIAGSIVAAAPAAAQQATITVTGNVLNGFDAAGNFGAANTNLTGLPFSAVFSIDAKAGNTNISTPSLSYLFGTGLASPVTAALTIGTGTYNFAGKLAGSARALNGVTPTSFTGTDGLYYSSEDTDITALPPPPASTIFYVSVDTLRDLLTTADFTSYARINLQPQDNAQGVAQIANLDPKSGTYAMTYANLSLSTISAKVTAPMPEPATWAMMIVGFGVAGVALRRQRATMRTRVNFA